MIDKSMHFSKSCVNSHLKVYDLGRDKIVECFTITFSETDFQIGAGKFL